jgi:hypothetical protein
MTCPDVCDRLPLLLDDTLPPAEAETLSQHLTGCTACRGELDALRDAVRLLDAVPAPRVQVDLARLYRDAAVQQEGRARRWRRLTAGAAALAAAAVLLAVLARFEVRVERHQVVVRWGTPPADGGRPGTPPEIRPSPGDELLVLRELVHALAANQAALDRRHAEDVDALRDRVGAAFRLAALRQADAERHLLALREADVARSKKGETP